MKTKMSDKIRMEATKRYVYPAKLAGKSHFSIRVRDLLTDLQAAGYPPNNTPRICSALKTSKFLNENGLELEDIEGPPKKQSPTVVFKYRITKQEKRSEVAKLAASLDEDPTARARRLTEKIRGILKDELAVYGGGEAFMRWIRSDDEDKA
jgi:hypothetical protein